MSSPDDGRTRCDWAQGDSELYRDYHDQEWGRPLRGRVALFERMSLEAFQSGLSWLIILRKRDNFRRAFDRFDIETVAGYGDAEVDRLMADAGIVRNRLKIEATIANARALLALHERGERLADVFEAHRPEPREVRATSFAEVPASTAESVALAKQLKRLGFRFVGPTTAYAALQALGYVDDHLAGCLVVV